jgi:hypothetical protein
MGIRSRLVSETRTDWIIDNVLDYMLHGFVLTERVIVVALLPEASSSSSHECVAGPLLRSRNEAMDIGPTFGSGHKQMQVIGHVAVHQNFNILGVCGLEKLQLGRLDN